MAWMEPALFSVLGATVILCAVYLWLWLEERETMLGIWAVAWGASVLRYVFLYIMLRTEPNNALTFLQLGATLLNSFFLCWGALRYLSRPIPRWFSALFSSVGIILAFTVFGDRSFLEVNLPVFFLSGLAHIWCGVILIGHAPPYMNTQRVLGILFLLWGAHKFDYPILYPIQWLAPVGFMAASILSILVAIVCILMYFQKSKRAIIATQATLADREQQLRLALTASDLAMWSWDPSEDKVTYSEDWLALTGYAPTAVRANIGFIESLLHPEDLELAGKALTDHLEGRTESFDATFRLRVQSGAHRWFRGQGRVLERDEDGKPRHMTGTMQDITARIKLEEDLREVEAVHMRLFQSMMSGAVLYEAIDEGKDFVLLNMNPAGERLSHVSVKEIRGRLLTEAFPDVQQSGFLDCLRQVHQTGVPKHIPLLHYHDERVDHILECWVFSLGPRLLVSFYNDLTEQKKVEQALSESEDRYQLLLQASRAMTIELDRDLRIQWFDSLARNITGYASDEVLDEEFCELFFVEKDKDALREQLKRVLAGDTFLNLESELTVQGDARRNVVLNAIPRRDAKDQISGILLSAQDVTELHMARARRLLLEQRLTAILNQAPVALMTLNSNNQFLYVSDNTKRLFGRDPALILQADYLWHEAIHPEDLALCQRTVARCLQMREPDLLAFRIQHFQTGESVYVRGEFVPSSDPVTDQEVLSIVLIDITTEMEALQENERIQKQLIQSETLRAIGQLAGGVAHDFNNLLGGIIGYGELLQVRGNLPEKERRIVGSILKTAERGADLVRQINTFARTSESNIRPVDLHEILRTSGELLNTTLGQQVDVILRLEARHSTLMGNATELQNLCINLGINARDAMPDGGEVCFRTQTVQLDTHQITLKTLPLKPGTYLCLSVRDTGTGMSPGVVSHIFEPFFTTKTEGQGTGLGLATTYGTVQSHSGHIDVESTLGKGTTFYIYLPCIDDLSEFKQRGEGSAEVLRPLRLLLVDDEDVVRTSLEQLLTSLGHTVTAFDRGESAVAWYADHAEEVDLVILDIRMPGLSGQETYNRLRALDPAVRVIVGTGYSDEEELRAMLEAGVCGYLNKPFTSAALTSAMKVALNAKEQA